MAFIGLVDGTAGFVFTAALNLDAVIVPTLYANHSLPFVCFLVSFSESLT